jgi:hypothetical protein
MSYTSQDCSISRTFGIQPHVCQEILIERFYLRFSKVLRFCEVAGLSVAADCYVLILSHIENDKVRVKVVVES